LNLNTLVIALLAGNLWTSTGIEGFLPSDERIGSKSENVAFLHDGTVMLAPAIKELAALGDASIWSIAAARNGTVYLGTGNAGRVYRVTGSRIDTIFDADAGEILALCTDARGNVYFAATPGGTIYRLRPGNEPEAWFETGEDYVFSLLPGTGGAIFCATGINGRLYRIDGKDRGKVIFAARQAHLTALAWLDEERELLVGTAPDGIVYQLGLTADRDAPRLSVLYDTPLAEVRTLAVTDNPTVYIGANPDEESEACSTGWVGCVDMDGVLQWQWTAPDSTVFALLAKEDGVLVATGGVGRIHRLDAMGRATVLQNTESANAVALLPVSDRTLIGTTDPALLLALGDGYARSGTLESEPHDCAGPSRFGRISSLADVPAGTGLEFDTRSGNSELPDSTWNDWLEVTTGSTSPVARFVQWRARLTSGFPGRTPVLRRVDLYYDAPNRSPAISGLEVEQVELTAAERGNNDPIREITWQVEDADGDSLEFELLFRGEIEQRWKSLVDRTGTPSHELDTRTLPDGWYRFRLTASDAVSRPANLARTSELTILPVLVDNSPPVVSGISARGRNAACSVRDAHSTIASCRVSVNAGPWQPLGPEDGILDETQENFSGPVELEPGENTLTFWAADAQGNTATGSIVVNR